MKGFLATNLFKEENNSKLYYRLVRRMLWKYWTEEYCCVWRDF